MNPDGRENKKASALVLETGSVQQTIALGQTIGRRLESPMTILLFGDLGSGKTAFAQGLARGLDVPESIAVTSPTYTLINEYPGRLPFYHVDLYRLSQPIDPEEIGLSELFADSGIVAIEWAERLDPMDRPALHIDLFFEAIDDTHRKIRIIACGLAPTDLLKDIGSAPFE